MCESYVGFLIFHCGFCGNAEPMWQLGLGGAESYPERPDEADCIYYLRTGFCGYGSRCRFNHPRDRGAVISSNSLSFRSIWFSLWLNWKVLIGFLCDHWVFWGRIWFDLGLMFGCGHGFLKLVRFG
jgi:hypothetical protein